VLFELTMDTLEQHGYSQYEISNYARPGKECVHNLAYWTGKEYLGLGPSAFSTVASRRWQNVPNTPEYIERIRESGSASLFTEKITPDIHRAEKIAFGLRTNMGIPEELVEPWHKHIGDLFTEGYVERNAGKVRLSRSGRMVADAIGEIFV
jgi:oxygen-independent coproporphyrinogen III oxidase